MVFSKVNYEEKTSLQTLVTAPFLCLLCYDFKFILRQKAGLKMHVTIFTLHTHVGCQM